MRAEVDCLAWKSIGLETSTSWDKTRILCMSSSQAVVKTPVHLPPKVGPRPWRRATGDVETGDVETAPRRRATGSVRIQHRNRKT